jgi:hypothetical protein
MEDNLDYRRASDADRLRSIYPGDPVGDYFFRPDVQTKLLLYDRRELLGAFAELAAKYMEHLVSTEFDSLADRALSRTMSKPMPNVNSDRGLR